MASPTLAPRPRGERGTGRPRRRAAGLRRAPAGASLRSHTEAEGGRGGVGTRLGRLQRRLCEGAGCRASPDTRKAELPRNSGGAGIRTQHVDSQIRANYGEIVVNVAFGS